MNRLRRIVLLRHGNTVGDSHERFHGSGDVALSDEGRRQVLAAGRKLATEVFDLVAASPLRRAWQSAALLSGGAHVLLVPEFREIDFGRWEGMTAEEIGAQDPVLYKEWREGAADFEFPGGERRAAFRERVAAGLEALAHTGAENALVVAHRGVIRAIGDRLLGVPLASPPELGGIVSFTRDGDRWFLGRRSSNPPALGSAA
ncbi:MAG TPA: histidine phosphatase family protein [Myxococcota bacterium]|nr:histidine phosphatase family protein [Myxococcota bacterium]